VSRKTLISPIASGAIGAAIVSLVLVVLGEIYSPRRAFLVGVAVFTLGQLPVCLLGQTMGAISMSIIFALVCLSRARFKTVNRR